MGEPRQGLHAIRRMRGRVSTGCRCEHYRVRQSSAAVEQKAICRSIIDADRPRDEAIARAADEIKLIREYRDRLIADAVTGQVDLRGWEPGPNDVVSDDDLAALGDDEAEPVKESADGDQ